MAQQYPPKKALPFLAGIVVLAVCSFLIRNPKGLGIFFRVAGVAAGVTYAKIEQKRRQVESGEIELDRIALAAAELDLQAADLELRRLSIEQWVESQLQAKDQELAERQAEWDNEKQGFLVELEQERQLIAEQWSTLYKSGDELARNREMHEAIVREWELKKDLLRQQLENELFDKQRELAVAAVELEKRENEFQLESSTKESAIQAAVAMERQAIIKERDNLIQELLHEQEKILTDKQVLEDRYNACFAELEAAKAEVINEREIAKTQVLELAAQRDLEFEVAKEQFLAEAEQDKAAYAASLQEYIDHQKGLIESLQAKIEELEELPKFGNEHGYAGSLGNDALAVLREFGCNVYPHQTRVLPWDRASKPAIVVWLRVGEETKPQTIFGCKDAIAARLQHNPVSVELDSQGFIAIGVGDVRGAIELPGLPGGEEISKERMARGDVPITEPTPELVEQVMARSYFYLIAGPPRSGKTAFTINLLDYSSAYFGRHIENIIVTPKYDAGTPWIIRGKKVMPKYCLMQPVEGLEEFGVCSDGLQDMYASVWARSVQLLKDEAAKRPLTTFKKALWTIDEVPVQADAYRAVVKTCVSGTVRVGGGLNVKVALVGQSFNCDDYGLRKPMLFNVTQFYLGAAYALEALRKGQVVVSPEKKRQIVAEIAARRKLADEQIQNGELVDGQPPAKYFALVAGEGEAFLMTLPPPGAYRDMPVMIEDESEAAAVPDEELTPMPRSKILEDIERELAEEMKAAGGEVAAAAAAPEPEPRTIDTSKMTPLQAAIVEWILNPEFPERAASEYTFSELYQARSIKREVLNWLAANPKHDGVAKTKVIRAACIQLGKDWKVGEVFRAAKGEKFRIR